MTVIIPFFLIASSYLTKLSITHFYIKLFPHNPINLICRLQFALLILTCIASIVRCFTLCWPLAYAWNRSLDGKCGDFKDFSLETSVVALVFDITCVVLPIPVVWGLKLERGKKIRLTVLFGLGFLICIITALRIYYTEKIDFTDLTRTAAPAVMFSVPEPALSIVAGCLPIIVPLCRLASSKLASNITNHVQRYNTEMKRTCEDTKRLTLQRHPSYLCPFPCSAMVVSRGSEYDSVSPLTMASSISFQCARGDVSPDVAIGPGITVLTEVRIDSARASWVR
ncbi:hypothetical protein K458DRAFT_30530 [Lentithecium fluviatile CBS 122367]|uniref:Rhodopsin domain-containing protein n=1 Tax=Lentithecium fluviatile CBS 122367 TaxID=1168545 RepID=A0A6G1J2B6_9PLEO|nr:hypothetical protein K458DRAFT_30530 [Lentithecium fluviatile CBS 122367]